MTGFPFGLPPSRPPPPKKKDDSQLLTQQVVRPAVHPTNTHMCPFLVESFSCLKGGEGSWKKKGKYELRSFFFLPILLLAVEIWLVVVATPPPDVKRPTRAGVFFTRRLSPSLPIGQVATVCVCVSTRTSLPKFTRVGSFSPVVFQLQWVS